MQEIWKDIPSFQGCYQASNLGNIRSVEHTVMRSNGRKKTIKEHILSPCEYDKYGHLMVCLKKNGESKHRTVHSLVAEAFIGERPNEKPVIRHLDGNPKNNQVDNIVNGTRKENTVDMVKQGRQAYQRLDDKKVKEIWGLIKQGIPHRKIAELYGVSGSCIMDIKMGRTYTYIDPFEE